MTGLLTGNLEFELRNQAINDLPISLCLRWPHRSNGLSLAILKLKTLHLNFILFWNPNLIWTRSLHNPTKKDLIISLVKLSVTCHLEPYIVSKLYNYIALYCSDILIKISLNSYLCALPFHQLTGVINFGYDRWFGQDLEIFQPKNDRIPWP